MSTLTVALVQTDIAWLDAMENFTRLEAQLYGLSKVDLILLPETFATGFAIDCDCAEPENGPSVVFMQHLAKIHQAVVAGSVLVTQGHKKANRFYWCWPDGQVRFYDKRHLFCLGKEGEYVVAGKARALVQIGEFKLLPQVCYDLRFPVFQRNRNDYDVMVNVANWPAARRRIWDTLLQARAIENQCFVLGVNRVGKDGRGTEHSGGTAAYNFVGEPIVCATNDISEVVIAVLDKKTLLSFKTQFPAHLDSDKFALSF
ncbi:Omega amidase (Nit2 homolog) [Pseudoalteromonas luteoviolacea B = ATCC 29581]|nr:Omega amidase (Nit2 homolog) [Pseudoalteromonas luteoviolacea B = ATCC 29581]